MSSSQAESRAAYSPPLSPLFQAHGGALPSPRARTSSSHSNGTVNTYQPMGNLAMHRNMSSQSLERPAALAVPSGAKPNRLSLVDPFGLDLVTTNHSPYDFARRNSTTPTSPNLPIPNSRRNSGILPVAMRNQSSSSVNTFSSASPDRSRVLPRSKLSTQTDFSSPSILEDSYKYAPTSEDFKNTSLYKRTMKAKKKLEEQSTSLPKSVSSPALDKTAAKNRRSSLFMMHKNPSTSTLNTLDSAKTANRKSRRLSTFWSFKSSPDLRVDAEPAMFNSLEMTPAPSAADSITQDGGAGEIPNLPEPTPQVTQLAAPPHTLHKRLSIVHEARPSMESESLSPFSSPSRLRQLKTIERPPKPLERPPPVIAVSTVSQTLTSASSLSPTFSSGSLNSASSSSSLPPQREAEVKAGDPTIPSEGIKNVETNGVDGNKAAAAVAAAVAGTAALNAISPGSYSAERSDRAPPVFPKGAPEHSEDHSAVTNVAELITAQSADSRISSDLSYDNSSTAYGSNTGAMAHSNYSGADRSGLQHSYSADTSTPFSIENATPHAISPETLSAPMQAPYSHANSTGANGGSETSQSTFYRAPSVLPYDTGASAPVSKQYSEVRHNLAIVRNAPRRHSSLQASVVGSGSASSSPSLSHQGSFVAAQEQELGPKRSRDGLTTPVSHTSVHSTYSGGLSVSPSFYPGAEESGQVSPLDVSPSEEVHHTSGLKGARSFVSENAPETGTYATGVHSPTVPKPTETSEVVVPSMYTPVDRDGHFSAAHTALTPPYTETNGSGISNSASTQTTNSMFDSSPVEGRTDTSSQPVAQRATLMTSPTRLRAITPPRTSSEQAKSLLAGMTMGGSYHGEYGTGKRGVDPSQPQVSDPTSRASSSDPLPPLCPDTSNEATPTRTTTHASHHAQQPSLTSIPSSSSLAQSRSSYVSARGDSSRLSQSSTVVPAMSSTKAAPSVTSTTDAAATASPVKSPMNASANHRDFSYPSIKPVQVRQPSSGDAVQRDASTAPTAPAISSGASSTAPLSSSKPLPPIGVASARTTRGFGLFKGGKSKAPEAPRNVSASSKASSKASDSTVTSNKRHGFFGFKFGIGGRKASADSTASSLPSRSGGTVIADVKNPTGPVSAANGPAKQLSTRQSQQFGKPIGDSPTAPQPLDKRLSQQFAQNSRNSQHPDHQQVSAAARPLAQRQSQQFNQQHTAQPHASRQQSHEHLRQQQSHEHLRQQQGLGVYQPQFQTQTSSHASQQRQSPVEARYGAQGPRPLPGQQQRQNSYEQQQMRQNSYEQQQMQAQKQYSYEHQLGNNTHEQQRQSMLRSIPEQRRKSQQLPFDPQQNNFHSQSLNQQRQSFQEQTKRYSHQYQSNGAQSRTGGATASPHTPRSRAADSTDPNAPLRSAKQSRGFLASLKNASSQSENYYSRPT